MKLLNSLNRRQFAIATVIVGVTSSSFEKDRSAVGSIGCDDRSCTPFIKTDIFDTINRHIGCVLSAIKSDTSTTSTPTEAEVLTRTAIAVLPPDLVAQQLQAMEKQDAIGLKLAWLKFSK